MARVVKQADVRRAEILDVAQDFFYTKGYERTSIQDIIDKIGIAKGTFYHYFNSKIDLLDSLIQRMTEQALEIARPIIEDEHLNALEKLERFFDSTGNWKLEQKAFFLELLQVWYDDNNAIFRHKMKAVLNRSVEPFLTEIIYQGIEEGLFSTDYPDDLTEIVMSMSQNLSETLGQIILNIDEKDYDLVFVERKVMAYEHAIERVLGAPPNSLNLFNTDDIKHWFE